eukprot:s324_g6.t1
MLSASVFLSLIVEVSDYRTVIERVLESFFEKVGRVVGTHPVKNLVCSVLFVVACGGGNDRASGSAKDPRGTISFSGGHSFTAPYFEATTTGAQSSAGRSDFTSPERPIVFCGQMSPPRASSPQELSPPVPMQLPIGPLQQAAALQPFPAQLQGMQFKSQVLAPQVQGRRYVPQAPTRSAVSLHVEDIGQPKMARSPQARSPLRQPPHTEGPLERTWEEAVQTLRQEVREQCRIQADVLRSEVAAMCTESRQQFQESLLKLQVTRPRVRNQKPNKCFAISSPAAPILQGRYNSGQSWFATFNMYTKCFSCCLEIGAGFAELLAREFHDACRHWAKHSNP